RMVATLTSLGVTVMMTAELPDSFTELRLSPHGTSFLTDAIILQRYVEIDGSLRKVMAVVKMRTRSHSKELRHYEITNEGIVVDGSLATHRGILTGNPELRATRRAKRTTTKKRRR
ncbi:MAG: RAD55 family ATPase, partial [Polyangiales bacterium]